MTTYRCTECDTDHKTFDKAAKCHWGIGGVEEVETLSNKELLCGMTGSAFLKHTRELAVAQREGACLTQFQENKINLAVDVFGPEYFYMDREL